VPARRGIDDGREGVAGFDGAIDDHEFAPARVGALRHRIVAHCSQTTRDLEVLDPVSHPQYEHAAGATAAALL